MRKLVKDLVNAKLSRRGFLSSMVAAGYTLSAAQSALQSVSPFVPGAEAAESFTRPVTGTGGDLLAEQIIEAGARYMFVTNGSGLGPLCDALVTRPQIQLIQAVHEGQAVSMADGYAKASGKIGFGMYSRVGLPNSSSNMYNAMKDRTPLVLLSDHADSTSEGTDSHEDLYDFLEPVKQYTKWRWVAHESARIPEWVRKGCKVSTVLPGGPTYIRIPRNLLYKQNVTASIFSDKAFHIPMELRPDPEQVERAAKMLLEASSPILYLGPEVSQTHARASLVELAELLAIPATQARSFYADFPNFHPLHVGEYGRTMRYPKNVDCFVNFGARFGGRRRMSEGVSIIHASVEPEALGRNTPVQVALVGHLDQVARDLVEAVKSMASPQKLKERTAARRAECASYTKRIRESRDILARRASGSPVPWQRLMVELNDQLDSNAVIVEELGTEGKVLNFFSFADDAKLKIGRTEGRALGWGVGASAGVKLGLPNRQVVSLQGDGGFLFGQTDSLWTMSRYDIPVLTIITNNQGYEEPRWNMMNPQRPAGKAGRDYINYLGNPDIDFTKLAAAYNIGGEVVRNTDQLRPAIQKALRALRDGRPYLLDVHILRTGTGAEVSWYPKFSLAESRERNV